MKRKFTYVLIAVFYLGIITDARAVFLKYDVDRGARVRVGYSTNDAFYVDNAVSVVRDVRAFGAKGDGATDDSAAFTAAAASLGISGGVILIPRSDNAYIVTASAITPGTVTTAGTGWAKPIWYIGQGWHTGVGAAFGDPSWLGPSGNTNGVTGSVIKVTGTNGGIVYNSQYVRGGGIRDIALVGPGSGTSVGIDFSQAGSSSSHELRNVGVFNFYRGIYVDNSVSNAWYNVTVIGNGTGLYAGDVTVTDLSIYRFVSQVNGTGVRLNGASIKFYGGLIQSNTVTGVDIIGGALNILDGIWFEGNTLTFSFHLTSNVQDMTISNCRSGDAVTTTFPSGGAFTVGRMNILNSFLNSATLSFPAAGYVTDLKIIGGTLSALQGTDNLVRPYLNTALTGTGINLVADAIPPVAISFDNAISLSWKAGTVQQIGNLTDNTTITVPSDAPIGARMTVIIREGAADNMTVTWAGGAIIVSNWTNTGGLAFKYSVVDLYMFAGSGASGQWMLDQKIVWK